MNDELKALLFVHHSLFRTHPSLPYRVTVAFTARLHGPCVPFVLT
jgi:hypothetical protein